MTSEIQKVKQDYGRYWQHEQDKKDLIELLERIKWLRLKIKNFKR